MPEFSSGLDRAWQTAPSEGVRTRHEFIEPEYLLVGIAGALPVFEEVQRLAAARCGSMIAVCRETSGPRCGWLCHSWP